MFEFLRRPSGADARLVRVNPWLANVVGPGSRPDADREFVDARRHAVHERLALGPAAWNRWAADMAAIRGSLSAPQLSLWHIAASVDIAQAFGRYDDVDLSGLHIPGNLVAHGAAMGRLDLTAVRVDGTADLAGADIRGPVDAQHAGFTGGLDLTAADLASRADFRGAFCRGPASVARSRWRQDAWFADVRFSAGIDARAAHFDGDAGFGGACFDGLADFSGARFNDNAGFEHATFAADVRFRDAVFEGRAWFRDTALGADAGFDRTRFNGLADFEGARRERSVSPVSRQIAAIERGLRGYAGR